MLENYYEKYNILRDLRTQERRLNNELEKIRKLYIMWKNQKEMYPQIIEKTRTNPDLSEEEREARILKLEQTLERNDIII